MSRVHIYICHLAIPIVVKFSEIHKVVNKDVTIYRGIYKICNILVLGLIIYFIVQHQLIMHGQKMQRKPSPVTLVLGPLVKTVNNSVSSVN